MTIHPQITAFCEHVRETQDGVTDESLAADCDALIHAGKMLATAAWNIKRVVEMTAHVNSRIDAEKLTRFICEAVDECICYDGDASALIRASAMDFLAGKEEG